jgi:polar amino acid transport system substrate-binding protein
MSFRQCTPVGVARPPRRPRQGRQRCSLVALSRSLVVLFACFAACALLAAPLRAQGAPADTSASEPREDALPRRVAIRFLTDSNYPPFNYFDEDNVLTGFNVDVARAICLELAAACDIQARPWSELLPALRRGETDAVIASHVVSASALQIVDFTDRYYHTPARLAGKRDAARLEVTPDGLEGKKIAVAKGTAHEAYLRTFFRDSSIRAYETPELARDALIMGAADLLFDDGISLAFWLNGTASKACCEFKGGPFGEPKYFGDGVAIAVKREDLQLKMLINAALHHIRASGRFEELVLRYFPLRAF